MAFILTLTVPARRAVNRLLRTSIPFTDEHGIPCYRVPLDNRGDSFAMVWAEDYHRIVHDLGFTAAWCLSSNGRGRHYVAANAPRVAGSKPHLSLIARVIAGVGRGQCARFVNGNPLDLRRSNPRVEGKGGAARHDAREIVRDAVERSREASRKAA